MNFSGDIRNGQHIHKRNDKQDGILLDQNGHVRHIQKRRHRHRHITHHEENDGVIARLISKGRHQVQTVPLHLPMGESTLYGTLVLPDMFEGSGPLYVSALIKASDQAQSEEDSVEF